MRSSWAIGFNGFIEVHTDQFARKFDDNGNKRLFQWNPYKQAVHVHPDYWDEFCERFEALSAPIGETAAPNGEAAGDEGMNNP